MVDYAVLGCYLGIVVWFGLRLGRGQRTVTSYLLGDRNLPWLAVLGSIIATETSSVTFLSIPGLAFANGGPGFLFLQLTVGYILGRLLVVGLFLPSYFSGTLFTAYQVLEERFGGTVKSLASGLFLVMRNLADGLRLYLTAIVLEQFLGWDLAGAILLIAVATAVYTYYGGLRSVVWNDCLQLGVYLLGALITLFIIAGRIGIAAGNSQLPVAAGLGSILSYGYESQRFQFWDASVTWVRPYTIWAGIFGGTFIALATHGTDQLMVQRYLAARGLREASLALALSGPLVAAQFALFLFVGVALAAYCRFFPAAVTVSSPDAALAYFVAHELPAGISGLVIAAVLAAAMSTLSSSLSASASAAVNDFCLKLYPGLQADPTRLLRLSRAITVIFACVQTGVAISGPYWTRTVVENVMAIATLTSGLTLGIFLLAVLCPRAGQRAALWGFSVGCIAELLAVWVFQVSWPWYAAVGALAVLGGGFVTSRIASLLFRR